MWPEVLAPRLGFAYSAAKNYAIAGTTTAGLSAQVGQITSVSGEVCAIWSGGNDFCNEMTSGRAADDTIWNPIVNAAVQNITNAVHALYAKGGRSFLVFNLPDMGRIPEFSPAPLAYRDYVSLKTLQFSTALAAALNTLSAQDAGLVSRLVDVLSNINQIQATPAALGFTVTTVGALDDAGLADKSFTGPGANYAFWDGRHPTAKAHSLIATWAEQALGGGTVPPPVVTIQPQSQVVPATSNVTFTVTATGSGLMSYQWRKGVMNIPSATSATLTLNSVTRGASGVYSVVVTSGGISTTSGNATLRVIVPQQLSSQRGGSGQFQLLFTDPDTTVGSDLARFEVHHTANFLGASTVWVTNSGSFTSSSGKILFDDTGSVGTARRFYRVIEK